jgi:hypothetical protein
MFGHQDEPAQQTNVDSGSQSTIDAPNPALPPAGTDFGTPTTPITPVTDTNSLLEPQAQDGYTEQAPVEPAAVPDAPTPGQPVSVGTPGPLTDLKQQALQQLTPLVNHLEQTPEEKFRTTMMLIQASDNQDLLQAAYEAANQISDEKAKAQALLDVINEINYFSQQQAS